ncbi:LutC/YkgG family protein [Desulfitobacterium sp.]|uniref:LutC/YkgG family protein n=1 Tax=Desulfitobacterium sp. TaxID=49981 RepID=UPI002BB7E76C|nr:LUD domain-containing protein [Desulfitobacterium sp.]HVJ47850.1 LUD domain-containing protein [Desulfitobacterium sp.]
MSDHQDFIKHLALKLGRPTPASVEPINVQVPHYQLNSPEERIDTLLANWESLGGKGIKAQTPEEAVQALKSWFGDPEPKWLNSTSIITWGELPDFAQNTFNQLHWTTQSYPDSSSERSARINVAAQAQLGVTGADYGIVQSGTLIQLSNARRGRAVSLVPPRHLAFLAGSKIKDELAEIMEELLTAGAPPAAIEMISGPSRTSDIEMDLSIGVHGPIEVYLVVMTEL